MPDRTFESQQFIAQLQDQAAKATDEAASHAGQRIVETEQKIHQRGVQDRELGQRDRALGQRDREQDLGERREERQERQGEKELGLRERATEAEIKARNDSHALAQSRAAIDAQVAAAQTEFQKLQTQALQERIANKTQLVELHTREQQARAAEIQVQMAESQLRAFRRDQMLDEAEDQDPHQLEGFFATARGSELFGREGQIGPQDPAYVQRRGEHALEDRRRDKLAKSLTTFVRGLGEDSEMAAGAQDIVNRLEAGELTSKGAMKAFDDLRREQVMRPAGDPALQGAMPGQKAPPASERTQKIIGQLRVPVRDDRTRATLAAYIEYNLPTWMAAAKQQAGDRAEHVTEEMVVRKFTEGLRANHPFYEQTIGMLVQQGVLTPADLQHLDAPIPASARGLGGAPKERRGGALDF